MPPFLKNAAHRWAWADRVAWMELSLENVPSVDHEVKTTLAGFLQRLDAIRKPIDPRTIHDQLIHGDMTGNVLFADDPLTAPPGIH